MKYNIVQRDHSFKIFRLLREDLRLVSMVRVRRSKFIYSPIQMLKI